MTRMRKEEFERELCGNILPYWMKHAIDREGGGLYGEIDSRNVVRRDAPKSAVLCARVLWVFSRAYSVFGDRAYWRTARHAYRHLTGAFWDAQYGGVYTSLNREGAAVSQDKELFSQAFALYAISEFSRATGSAEARELALSLFAQIEQKTADQAYGGYFETMQRDWTPIAQAKTANAHMHLLEAYTNLLTVWTDDRVRKQLHALTCLMVERAIRGDGHMTLRFDRTWVSTSEEIQFGQDIENGWLMYAGAKAAGDDALVRKTHNAMLALATAIYGLDEGTGIPYGCSPGEPADKDRCWWVQAEAVVGYFTAWRISGDERFYAAADRVWAYIQAYIVDRKYGEWHCRVSEDGIPRTDRPKVSAWKCPYHNARMCFVMMEALAI